MDINAIADLVNSVGLAFDLSGAWLLAYEVVKQFRGQKYEASPAGAGVDPPPRETKAFSLWERTKFTKMRRGLVLLAFGFFLQLVSNWLWLFP
jgi:hypothetical protein